MRLSLHSGRLSAAVAALAAAVMPFGAVALAITGGSACSDPDGLRRHVVRIVSAQGTACSGAIIGARKIVTAAHCFLGSSRPGDYRVMVLDHGFNAHWLAVSAVRLHPAFNRQGLARQAALNDIAVVKTAENLPADMAVAALAGGMAPGEVTAAGFGSGQGGHLRQARLRAGDAVLSSTGSQILRSIDGGACEGDSGGPVFRRSARGYALVGVISWTAGACGGMTAVMPVARYRAFLGG